MATLVTGAANGIGLHLSLQLYGLKQTLILVDKAFSNNHRRLFSREGKYVRVHFIECDVNDREKFNAALEEVRLQGLLLTEVYINAGEIENADGSNYNQEVGRKIMQTNFFGAINTYLQVRDVFSNSRILFIWVTSISSLVSTHNSGWYSASKTGLSRYIDSVRLLDHPGLFRHKEIVLGFVATRMTSGLAHAKYLCIPPDVAAQKIIRASKSWRVVTSIPFIRNLLWYFFRELPPTFRFLLLSLLGRFVRFNNSLDKYKH